MKKRKISFSTTHIIMLSFLVAIFVGAVLLTLPISTKSGTPTPFIDALFTATTSTCVTGLVVVSTATHWSTFGHIVILLLIQLGGLGIITVMSCISFFINQKMGLSGRLLLQDSFNLNSLSNLSTFVKKVVLGALSVEGVGALIYMTVFVPQFGLKGIWFSVFNSVSAFCNAGIDILGDNSLSDYTANPIINGVTCGLITLGGLGFVVWFDVLRVLKERKERKIKLFSSLTLHSKIALTASLTLLLVGAVATLVFEYNNPKTIGEYTLFNKIQAAFFQSVTTRTAGFFTIPQHELTNGTSFISVLLMFIGGSPIGTAGGAKTVTLTVLFASAIASVKNKNEVSLFGRSINEKTIRKAVAVTVTSFSITVISTILLICVTDAPFLDILYEAVSATATVGLTRNLTPSLNAAGKLIIIASMYLGRIGPISLAVALNMKKENKNIIKNPTEDISVG